MMAETASALRVEAGRQPHADYGAAQCLSSTPTAAPATISHVALTL